MYDDSGYNDVEDDFDCDVESKNIIKLKLIDIQSATDLDTINCKFSPNKMKPGLINFKEAQIRLALWTNIAKLSIYLLNDFEFFSQMTMPSAFYNNHMYNIAMENLGYNRRGRFWQSVEKPTQDRLIECIYKYCYYSHVLKLKRKENLGRDNPNVNKNQNQNRGNFHPNERRDEFQYKNQRRFDDQDRYRGNSDNYNLKPFNDNRRDPNFRRDFERKPPEDQKYFNNKPKKPEKQMSKAEELVALQKTNDRNKVDKPLEENKMNKWTCQFCEKLNSYDKQLCEVCDSEPPHNGKWACSECTFLNERRSVSCDVCGHLKR